MRSTAIVVSLFACLGVAGCMSGSGIDALAPSLETTSSIARPSTPVPEADVGVDAPAEAVAQAGQVGELAEPAEPAVTPIALVAVPKPVLRDALYSVGKIHRRRFRDAHPINFGKRSPKKLAVHGVDISRWQGDIDWAKLRGQGANFVFIKATDGGDHLDPMFMKNWRNAHAAGLKRGAYHFFYWCRTAAEQADWFIRNVPKVAGALPPVLDVEWNHQSNCKKTPSRATVLEKMQVFMDRLEAHYGQRPIIYTAPDFYDDNLKGAFPNHPFWLRSVAAHPSKVYPGRKWVFWQYSGSGLSHGVDGRIDLNVFHGDESEWRAWVRQNAG